MEQKDIRWKQRFENFSKSIKLLERALNIESPDIIQKAGTIQFFEMCFELSWNMLKDYLEEQGFIDVNTPRSSIKKAFEIGLIEDGHQWMELLVDRNLTVHTYDEKKATDVERLIHNKYYPLLKNLHEIFKQKTSL